MSLFTAIKRWVGGLFPSNQTIKEAFGIDKFAISQFMLERQELYRSIMRGNPPWVKDEVKPSMLAAVVVGDTVDEVLNDFKTEVIGPLRERPNPRAEFLNKHYQKFVDGGLEEVVINFLSEGETILKPWATSRGLEVTIVSTDSYRPLAYNSRKQLVDVVFTAKATKQNDDKHTYTLLERHTWNEERQEHYIVYRAYKSKNTENILNLENHGERVSLSVIPEWAFINQATNGEDSLTISGMEQPLFIHACNRSNIKLESPQLQGLPMFVKSVQSGVIEKIDKQEARTDAEYDLAEMAIDAPESWFRRNENGELIMPKGKERLFRVHQARNGDPATADVFSPDIRYQAHGDRANRLRRYYELESGMSYGMISDNNNQDRTAEEYRASKKRLINTVMRSQAISGVAIDALIYSWDRLLDALDIGGGIPFGDYEVVKQWNESLAADRPREFDERIRAQGVGMVEQWKNYAWFNEVDEETAKAAVAEINSELPDEYE